jgi:hypothetical protein
LNKHSYKARRNLSNGNKNIYNNNFNDLNNSGVLEGSFINGGSSSLKSAAAENSKRPKRKFII